MSEDNFSYYSLLLTSFISLQDLLQHFKGVRLARRRTGLLILLDHLVNLRIPVESLHCKVRARTAAGGRDRNTPIVTSIEIIAFGRRVQYKMHIHQKQSLV